MTWQTRLILIRVALALLFVATLIPAFSERRGDKIIWLGRDWRDERAV